MGKSLGMTQLKMMIDNIYKTRDRELTCSECLEAMDVFAEHVLAGKNPEDAVPLVQDHLTKCGDCREEFEALLNALETLED